MLVTDISTLHMQTCGRLQAEAIIRGDVTASEATASWLTDDIVALLMADYGLHVGKLISVSPVFTYM